MNTKMDKEKIINLSSGYPRLDFDTSGMHRAVILPDYSPCKGGLPVGIVAIYRKNEHIIEHSYLGSDAGCGMLLALLKDFPAGRLEEITNGIAAELLDHPTGLGSLGSGNHFVTLYESLNSSFTKVNTGDFLVAIHSGGREKGRKLYDSALLGNAYLAEQASVIEHAKKNRLEILRKISEISGCNALQILDRTHNFVEADADKIVYRKGAVKLMPGEISFVPSSMTGEAAIVRAKSAISETEFSFSHATGRRVSRSEAKKAGFFLEGLPNKIYIPYFISLEHLNTEMPQCYRTTEEILPAVSNYVTVEARLKPKSSIML
jgi:RNA-splicing ligase RtcB